MTTTYLNAAKEIGAKTDAVTHEGGLVYAVDKWTRLNRFLVLGSEGTFYVGARALAKEHAGVVQECLDDDPIRAIDAIHRVLQGNAAPKQDPALFALALVCAHENVHARSVAFSLIESDITYSTALFNFVSYMTSLRGWGRAPMRAVAQWYDNMPVEKLGYQAIKYRQRNGWTHKDLLRLSHRTWESKRRGTITPNTNDADRSALYRWIVSGDFSVGQAHLPTQVGVYLELATLGVDQADHAAELISRHNMPREAVPTEFLNSPVVWSALLEQMPMTAMIRNLGVMSKVGLLTPMSDAATLVTNRLSDVDALRKAKIHPMAVLLAMKTYQQGHGDKGKSSWSPVSSVVDALDGAFYDTFANATPSGKNILLALDCSASMSAPIMGTSLSCTQAAAAMALITAATEPNVLTIGFDTSVKSLTISARQRLDDVVRSMGRGGGTDTTLPVRYAASQGMNPDVIIWYTDSETRANGTYELLKAHRAKQSKMTKAAVIAMTANNISIIPESDPAFLGVCGMDSSVPALLGTFIDG